MVYSNYKSDYKHVHISLRAVLFPSLFATLLIIVYSEQTAIIETGSIPLRTALFHIQARLDPHSVQRLKFNLIKRAHTRYIIIPLRIGLTNTN